MAMCILNHRCSLYIPSSYTFGPKKCLFSTFFPQRTHKSVLFLSFVIDDFRSYVSCLSVVFARLHENNWMEFSEHDEMNGPLMNLFSVGGNLDDGMDSGILVSGNY